MKAGISEKVIIEDVLGSSITFFTPEEIDNIVDQIIEETSKYYMGTEGESNFVRIINSMYQKNSILKEMGKYPHHLEIITALATNSNFLSDIIVRNPEYLYQLFDNYYLNNPIIEKELEDEIQIDIQKYKSFEAKLNYLRRLKRRYLLKIGLNDILGNSGMLNTTGQISFLAKNICAAAFNICYYEILKKHNLTEYGGFHYTLSSLGKLGGEELNYSSDVDFILFYSDSASEKINTEKEYYELLTETVHKFVAACTEKTEEGFLYRVDFRLRPDGYNSPLCGSVGDYLRYYELRGEDWERQMLIKLNFVCGSFELFNQFYSYINSFIFPASFKESPKSQIKRMKDKIEKKDGNTDNVKTFVGGIRDIEFSLQALQLLNGGKHKELRTGKSLTALKELLKLNLLTTDEFNTYRSAYIFLRKIEHFIQLMNDTQTHVIPDSGEIPAKLAHFMGYPTEAAFRNRLADIRKQVRNIFNAILEIEETSSDTVFDKIAFRDKNKAIKNLYFLETGTGLAGRKEFDNRTIERFSILKPELLKELANSANPDVILENIVRLISSSSFTSIWYQEFQNFSFFKAVLKFCEFSNRGMEAFITDKRNPELLLTRKVFTSNINALNDTISLKELYFILSIQYNANLLSHERFSEVLANYIDNKVKKVCESISFSDEFFIIGLGSYGVKDLHFCSDIDLIVVAKNITDIPQIQNEFQEFHNKIRQELHPLEVDFKLRPEGSKSPLVWDIIAYKNYLENRARVWEFQSFIKMRKIYGSDELFNEFNNAVKERLALFDKTTILNEILAMYKKFTSGGIVTQIPVFNVKKSKGGLVSLDFMLQYLLLCNHEKCVNFEGKSQFERYSLLKSFNFTNEELEQVKEIHGFYKNVEISIQNIFNLDKPVIPNDPVKKKYLADSLGITTDELKRRLDNAREKAKSLFEKFVK